MADSEVRRKLKQQLRSGHFYLAAKTIRWMMRENWHERRWGIYSSNDHGCSEYGENNLCHMYQTMGYETIHRIFKTIAPRSIAEQEVLLDAGCGLGRVLLEAARHPYLRVLGFDYSRSLVEAAQGNIEAARPQLLCSQVEAEWGDANTYIVPDTVTTLFLFNPFRGETMQRFMANVRESLARRPRRLRVLFANPMYFDPAEFPWLKQIHETLHHDPHVDDAAGCHLRVLLLEARAGQAG